MKNFNILSEAENNEWLQELRVLRAKILCGDFSITRKDFISEHEVVELLQVTSRTMRTYRQKRYLHFIKMNGSIFYLRHLFYIDLVMMSQRSWNDD